MSSIDSLRANRSSTVPVRGLALTSVTRSSVRSASMSSRQRSGRRCTPATATRIRPGTAEPIFSELVRDSAEESVVLCSNIALEELDRQAQPSRESVGVR
ncbi:MAG: hypothetical protein R6U12_17370 [Thioalkalivibrio sp.]